MSWLEVDRAGWRWAHNLVIPIKYFYFRNLYTSIIGDYLFILTNISTYLLSLLENAGFFLKYNEGREKPG